LSCLALEIAGKACYGLEDVDNWQAPIQELIARDDVVVHDQVIIYTVVLSSYCEADIMCSLSFVLRTPNV